MTEEMKEQMNEALFSRCSAGKNRWFWVVWESWENLVYGSSLASGYATTPLEAEQQALAVVPGAKQYGAGYAAGHHHRLSVEKRKQKPASKSTETMTEEFLYHDRMSDDWSDSSWHSTPYKIMKKTKKYVFIETGNWRHDPWDVPTYRLDRRKLETEGKAMAGYGTARDYYYTTPADQRRTQWSPPYLNVLGLKTGATTEEIKAAYRRLAKANHPDRGGDPEQFKKIHAAFEEAMKQHNTIY